MAKVDVSIVVITYNHEKYLKKTLEGIEEQEFNGTIEIIIHDDASTDNTNKIYEEFKKISRHRIKIIRPENNKYSQRINFLRDIFTSCEGEFVALCEGDDYWIRKSKIQEQVTTLRLRADVDLCFHRAITVNYSDIAITGTQGDFGENPLLITPGQIIERTHGVIPTAATVIRKDAIKEFPDWLFATPSPAIADYYIQVMSSLRGGGIYLPITASAYRKGDPKSWTNQSFTNQEKWNKDAIEFIKYLLRLKKSTKEQLHQNINNYAIETFKHFLYKNLTNTKAITEAIHAMQEI